MIKKIIGIIGIIAIVVLVIMFNMYRNNIYRTITPNVEGLSIGNGFIDNVKYKYVVDSNRIFSDEEGDYLYMICSEGNFWYEVNVIKTAYIEKLTEDKATGKVAIRFLGEEPTGLKLILVGENGNELVGKEVFVVRK